jgi:hypothetical protein
MIKKLAVVVALVMVASLSLAGCIKIIERKNDDTEQHYPTLTKEASSSNAMVIITYPKYIYPLKVRDNDGVRWRWSWKIQFAEVNGTAVSLNCVNRFVSSSGVSYGPSDRGQDSPTKQWLETGNIGTRAGWMPQSTHRWEISFRVLGYRPVWPTPVHA